MALRLFCDLFVLGAVVFFCFKCREDLLDFLDYFLDLCEKHGYIGKNKDEEE